MSDEGARRVPALAVARRALRRRPSRTALAALGVAVAVVAVATLGMFGTALERQADASLGGVGTQVAVSPGPDADGRYLAGRDLRDLDRAVGGRLVPRKRGRATVRHGHAERRLPVYAVENPAAHYEASEGRIPRTFDGGVLVSRSVAAGFGVGPGDAVTVGNRTLRVAAVLAARGGPAPLAVRGVIVPMDYFGDRGYADVVVVAEDPGAAEETVAAIETRLNDRRERFAVRYAGSYREQLGAVYGTLDALLVGVGAVSLAIAGGSVLAVTLTGAVERRREFGVLRAVGFREREVMLMVLAEALLLGALGGVAGVCLAVVVGVLLNQAMLGAATATFLPANLLYLGGAFLLAAGAGVLGGLYPARKAATTPPDEAMRP